MTSRLFEDRHEYSVTRSFSHVRSHLNFELAHWFMHALSILATSLHHSGSLYFPVCILRLTITTYHVLQRCHFLASCLCKNHSFVIKKKNTILLRARFATAQFCSEPCCVHRAYVKKKQRHFVTGILVSVEPMSKTKRKSAILMQAFFAAPPFCYRNFCVRRTHVAKKSAILLRKEKIDFLLRALLQIRFCCGQCCVRRTYVKKKQRHFVTGIFVSIEPIRQGEKTPC